MSRVEGWKVGDEVYVDTSKPMGWPDFPGGRVFNTGIREAVIVTHHIRGRHIAFQVGGIFCSPSAPESLIRGRIIRQLEND